jgi:SSS family solute:Na+ symporter
MTSFGINTIILYIITIGLAVLTAMDYYQRAYAAKDVRTAKLGLYFSGPFLLTIGFGSAIVGMADKVISPQLVESKLIAATMIKEILPVGLLGLALGGFLATLMSCGDSVLMVCATTLSRDIYNCIIKPDAKDKEIILFTRFSIVLVGLISLLLAIYIPSVMELLLYGFSVAVGGLLFPTVMGLHWKRGSAKGALVSIIVGGGITALWPLFSSPFGLDGTYIGLPLSFIMYVLISCLTKKPSKEKLKYFFY